MSTSSRTVEHVGEWKIAARAPSMEGLFAEVALVVADAAGTPVGAAGEWEPLSLEAPDAAALLVDWANELIGRGEVTQRAYGDVRALAVDETPSPDETFTRRSPRVRVRAQVRGRPVAEWRSPLKAATYHRAVVERAGDGWRAEILFDV